MITSRKIRPATACCLFSLGLPHKQNPMFSKALALNVLRKILLAMTGICSLPHVAFSESIFVPFGPQNNVAITTVTDVWGWSVIYDGAYGEFDVPIDTVFGAADEYLMLGAYRVGDSSLSLLAAAPTVDVLQFTGRDSTRNSNGSEWYYNAYSLGFAGQGQIITQNFADEADLGDVDRLSWHTGVGLPGFNHGPIENKRPSGLVPLDIDGGFRAGSVFGLNSSTEWRRIVFTAVPEPQSAVIVAWYIVGWRWRSAKRERPGPGDTTR